MDEIWFHLSNQFEALQVRTLVVAHQGQEWMSVWLAQARRFFYEIYNDQNIQNTKDFAHSILAWIQKAWEQLQFQYYSTHFSIKGFTHHIINFCNNEGTIAIDKISRALSEIIEIMLISRKPVISLVSRRELTFCLAGIAVGTLIGYYAGCNWGHVSHHMHHMKTIICYDYIGIEGVSLIDDAEMPMIQRSNELLVQVKAASLNIVDTKICHGYSRTYRRLLNSGRHKGLPVTLGRDCTGVVVGIGQRVINFDIGDEVFLAVPSWAPGTMAEYIVVPETQVIKRPKLFPFEASASLPYSGCLAWDALVNRSTIEEGNAKGKRYEWPQPSTRGVREPDVGTGRVPENSKDPFNEHDVTHSTHRKKKVLICGGNTTVGCILIQLVKLWGGHVVTICRPKAIYMMKALGADEIILSNGSNIQKELELHDKYNDIFYTGGEPIDERILKQHLLPHGSFVSTIPEQLTSDSLGFILGSVFSGCIRIKLLIQYILGFNMHHWKDGSKLNATYLQALADLSDADELVVVVDKIYRPHDINHALRNMSSPDAIGSTIITFQ